MLKIVKKAFPMMTHESELTPRWPKNLRSGARLGRLARTVGNENDLYLLLGSIRNRYLQGVKKIHGRQDLI